MVVIIFYHQQPHCHHYHFIVIAIIVIVIILSPLLSPIEAVIFAVMKGIIICNCVKKFEKFRTSTGFEPVTSRYRCDALTNWAMKPLTLGVGHFWVLMFAWGMNERWNDIYEMDHIWTTDMKSSEAVIFAVMNAIIICNCEKKPEHFRASTGFEPVTSRYIWSISYISFHR